MRSIGGFKVNADAETEDEWMTRFVIDAGIALRIVEERIPIAPSHSLLAPTLLRSQVLDMLYGRVRRGALTEEAGVELNARFGKLKMRYLGDAVLRRRAWALAARMELASTFDAEYVALTQLQGDALITEKGDLASTAKGLVTVRSLADLSA